MYRENCEYHEKDILMNALTTGRSSRCLCLQCTQLEVFVALFKLQVGHETIDPYFSIKGSS